MTTNVRPSELNYDHYTMDKYDQDIVNSIPCHREIHERIARLISENFEREKQYNILDLGVGTGITSKIIQDILPKSELDAVDFSEKMMEGAKRKLGPKTEYILGDYATMEFPRKYDIITSVIGIHHQNHQGKRDLFRKVYDSLTPKGVFVFGDLVTYKDPRQAALNNALHYHHLVEHASDPQTLEEWTYHHMFLNDLAPIEDQIEWLKEVGFQVKKEFLKMNTALLWCTKQN